MDCIPKKAWVELPLPSLVYRLSVIPSGPRRRLAAKSSVPSPVTACSTASRVWIAALL